MSKWEDFNSTKPLPITNTTLKSNTKEVLPVSKDKSKWDKFNQTSEFTFAPVPPKPTLGQKVGNVAKEIGKAIASPVVTTVARPIQAGAALAGVPTEKIDKFTLGGLIAPTPKSSQDVWKDVGRAAQTVALGLPFGKISKGISAATMTGKVTPQALKVSQNIGKLGAGAIEGGAFGYGMGMEETGKPFSTESLKQTGIGAGLGGVLPPVLGTVGKMFQKSKVAPKIIEKIAPKIETKLEPKLKAVEIDGGIGKLHGPREAIPQGSNIKAKSPVKLAEKTYQKFDDMFDEVADREYKKSTVNEWWQKSEKTFQANKVDDIIDTIYDNTKAFEDGLPKEAMRKFLQLNKDKLTTKQKKRIINKLVTSEAAAEMRASQIFMDDGFEYAADKNKIIQDKIKKSGYTQKSILKFLDDNQCPI